MYSHVFTITFLSILVVAAVVVAVAAAAAAAVDCKTVGFFLKISKEIGETWRMSYARKARESHTPFGRVCFQPRARPFLFDCPRLLEYGKKRTVLQSTAAVLQSYPVATYNYVTSRLFPVVDYWFINNLYEGK